MNQRAVRCVQGILIGLALAALVSCAQRGAAKPVAAVVPVAAKPVVVPPPPPPPLSSPQTRVELPTPQPIDPAALDTETAPPEAPAATRTQPQRRPTVITPPAPPAPTTSQPAEPPRETIQEIIPAGELKRLQEQVQGRRKEVDQILAQVSKRRLTQPQHVVVTNIRNFLALSEEAEKRNDMRQADALAERAQILARDLQNGK
jgi:hypothetical protein